MEAEILVIPILGCSKGTRDPDQFIKLLIGHLNQRGSMVFKSQS